MYIFIYHKCDALQLPEVNGQNMVNRIELIMLKIFFSPVFDHFSGSYFVGNPGQNKVFIDVL